MRITQNATLNSYELNLSSTRESYTRNQFRVTTGKQIQSPSDSPSDFSEIKRLGATIDRNMRYQTNIQDAMTDTNVYENTLQNFSDTLDTLRNTALDAVKPENGDKLPVLAENIKNLLGDLIQTANYEFDGRFAFSGTQTTRASITPVAPETDNLPFELVQDPAIVSPSNPQGLRVSFKGNNNDRFVTTSANSTERVNSRAQDAFGGTGAQVFQQVIDIYNILAYQSNGTPRTNQTPLDASEARQLQDSIKQVGGSLDNLNSEIGRVGSVSARMQAITDQITTENTTLRALRSSREDADIPQAILDMKKDENALQASLQVGSNIFQQSLLDFLK